MNSTLPDSVEELLAAYERKRAACGLEFTPPEEKARLGKYAFAGDLISQIMVGVATGILAHIAKQFYDWAKASLTPPVAPEDVVKRAIESSRDIEDGIRLLEQQGIRAGEAKAAMELLKQAITEVVLPKTQ